MAIIFIPATGSGISGTDWVSYTPTGAFVTNVTYTGKWRQVGDTIFCVVRLAFAGATTVATFTVSLPSGKTIDTTKLLNATLGVTPVFGTGTSLDAGTTLYIIQPLYADTTHVRASYFVPGAGYTAEGYITNSVPFTFGNTDELNLCFSVPIT